MVKINPESLARYKGIDQNEAVVTLAADGLDGGGADRMLRGERRLTCCHELAISTRDRIFER